MKTRRHAAARLSLRNAVQTIEFLEPRNYLSGVVFQTPGVSTDAATAGISPNFATLFDFNGDGKADLVTANTNNTVSVLLGNGDGTFQTPATTITVGTNPIPLLIADITGDGKPDILTGNDSTISIIPGNGDGTFGAPVTVTGLSSNSAIGVGNFNGDSRPDIVTVNKSASAAANDRVGVLFQNSNGTFTLARMGGITHTGLAAVAVGNFVDGQQDDIAIVDQTDNLVTVILGNGNGTFASPVDYATGSGPTSIVASDFDGDSNLDLVTADSTGQAVSFLKNNGDGTFAAPVDSGVAGTPAGFGPLKVRLTNINGDSKTDLVVLDNGQGAPDATVLLGNGDGTFHTGTTITTSGTNARTSIATGDLNNDGFTDAVVADPTDVTALINVTNQDNEKPTASVPANQATAVPTSTTYDFTVIYTDNTQIDASTLGDTNLTVTGPNGFSQQPTLVSQNVGNAASVTVTYELTFPSGLAASDSGNYTVSSNADSLSTSAVKDAKGNPLAAGAIGTLTLSVNAQQVTPPPQAVAITTLVKKKVTLKPGKSKSYTFSKYFFPAVNGNFFLLVTVTSSNGDTLDVINVNTKSPLSVVAGAKGKPVKFKVVNNTGALDSKDTLTFQLSASPSGATNATPAQYNIQPAFVDLVNQWNGVLPATLPAAGKKLTLTVPVLDNGNVKAKGTVDVTITPILNGVAQTPIVVGEKVSLTNGKTKTLHVKLVVPALASGTYTATLAITPVLGFVDSNPANDTVASTNSTTV
jgi:hypothetical protein